MKIVQINATGSSGSTGKICVLISKKLQEHGVENYILYSEGESDYAFAIKYVSERYRKIQALKSRIFGNFGFNSKTATKKLIEKLNKIKPDIVHLHNLHSHNVNLPLLLNYLKQNKIKTFWTFHDCWAFTGYCTHFDMVGCDKYKTECKKCPLKKQFSWFFDKSNKLFKKKKELLADLDFTIVTPSEWLKSVVAQSFLKNHQVKVVNNGIDLNVFKPTETDLKKRFGLEDKKIVLGVANIWNERKGLDIFLKLPKLLGDKYQLILVGKTSYYIPPEIIYIERTENQSKLSEFYSMADVFVNPTREDNFPTVNIESLACGTPVVTFDTGGSPEIIDAVTGVVVEKDNIDDLVEAIINTEKTERLSENCIRKAGEFSCDDKFDEYLKLYGVL